ncbi:MAG: type I DNA topoisomerase [Schleiferiaceae bacterium]|nr:type I DNA topoisomerase [Schleiferiaceae bacterium]
MAKNLVIVESPAKAKTIEKYLGKDYKVMSSFGHIRDLPKKDAIDIENGFEPKYVVPADKKKVVADLKKSAKSVEKVWLASDEDREGEAIAWHLYDELKLNDQNTERIVFHEITKSAILNAIENPRKVDLKLKDAQQARRVLDRLVGFELSPVLWRKVKGGLSAGRVQSVAVRLIVEKEREITGFEIQSSFRVVAEFINNNNITFKAELNKKFGTKEEALAFLNDCKASNFTITSVDKKPAKRTPAAPFTTSTLQQEASRKLGFSVAQTMQVAQRLYESGAITYMRTDSVNLSLDALSAIKAEIETAYGTEYHKQRNYTNKSKGAQEAHEAIRPTNMANHNGNGDYASTRLYQLIWKRTIASQMADAQIERTTADISISQNPNKFVAKGEVIKFDGFIKAYLEGTDEEDIEEKNALPALHENETLNAKEISATERFSRPPARYTEASLVKKLEELGIGRPSTYAPTISTIQKRGYVEKPQLEGKERAYERLTLKGGEIKAQELKEITGADKNKLYPTDIGIVVNDYLVEHFQQIMDYNFTAQVENKFDHVATGDEVWNEVIADFYGDFHNKVEEAAEGERATGERELGTDPKSGNRVIARIGRFGPMIQIGEAGDENNKPQFASIPKGKSINNITLEDALDLFQLPKNLGQHEGEDAVVALGRFGPYVKYGSMFVSLAKGEDPMSVDLDRAVELIEAKKKADAPIAEYENMPVQKGVGRFGPFIKWNNTFINVNKKYDFDNLSHADIVQLIEDKKRKDIEKVVHNWEDEGIRVEKARWGRHNILKGKFKLELPKTVDAKALTLDEVKALIEKNAPKKKTRKTPAKKKAK